MKRRLVQSAVVLAVLAGAYLCSIGAYDHSRAPAAPAPAPVALASAARNPSCAPAPGGRVECVEEIAVVERRGGRPVVLSRADRLPASAAGAAAARP